MARPYRLQGEGLLYHIISRGDDRKKIFISQADYEKFLEYLKIAKEKFKFYIYAWCLIDNHYHLLLETTQANLSRIMQYLNTSYTVYYNTKRNKCGHLFQGRFKSILIDKDNYFIELTRYIHLNPARAKITDNPINYKWSSYSEYINKPKEYTIDKEELKKYLTMNPNQYRDFVLEGIGKEENLLSQVYAGFILGKERFIKEMLRELKVQVENEDFSHKKKIFFDTDSDAVIRTVGDWYKKEPEVLLRAKKKPLLAKKIALYLLKKYTSLTNKDIGIKFGISYSAVSKAFRDTERLMIEDNRVKRDVERIISHFKV